METNFDLFRHVRKWFFKKNSTIEILTEKSVIKLSEDFRATFPTFSELVSLAEITEVKINEDTYRLFAWTNKENEKFGWIADIQAEPKQKGKLTDEQIYPATSDFLKEHLLLVNNIGGIAERWNDPDNDSFMTWAKNFIFSLSDCYKFKSQESIYHEDRWIFEPVENPLDISKLLCFSEEGNGDMTFYNTETSEIFLLLHDHCFDYVTELEGHPEYSFYTINGIKTFVEYAELLAKQILTNVK